MGTSEGQRVAIARMFVLRTLLPPGRIAVGLWTHHLDLVLFAAAAAILVFVATRRREDGARLAFLVAALFVALGPSLPLSISLVNTLSERYVYLATVFSCALVAWAFVRLTPLPGVGFAGVVLLSLFQWHYLMRANDGWRRGDEVFRLVVDGVLAVSRQWPPGTTTTLLLNAPDTIDRPHVDGAGMLVAIHLMTAAHGTPEPHVRIVAMVDSSTGRDTVNVRQNGRRLDVDLGAGVLIDGWCADQPEFSVIRCEPHAFAIAAKPVPRRLLVAYTSAAGVRPVATIGGVPFGFVDLPVETVARCQGDALRISGWALDDDPNVSVRIEADSRGERSTVGTAEWRRGTRPDVTGGFGDYPDAERAEWNYSLPCSSVPMFGVLTVHAIAYDSGGQEVELGTRIIKPGTIER